MPPDWTIAPDQTETLDNGGKREWASREIDPPAPPQPTLVAGDGAIGDDVVTLDFTAKVPSIDTPTMKPPFGGFASLQVKAANSFDAAKANSAKRFDAEIGAADAELASGKKTWRAFILWLAIGACCCWGIYVTVWGSPITPRQYPQTQPSITPGAPGVGVNHSRDLLIEWSRGATWKRLRAEEQEAARKAVEADR